MKKFFLPWILFASVCMAYPVQVQDSLGNITELQKLLKERKDRFEDYATSADQRSGIFKMKTKKDLEQSREILLQIVKTDNRIFNELSAVISRRGMAKADYSYDEITYKETINRLTQAADTLNKQLAAEKQLHAVSERKASTQQWVTYILLGLIAVLVAYIFLRRK